MSEDPSDCRGSDGYLCCPVRWLPSAWSGRMASKSSIWSRGSQETNPQSGFRGDVLALLPPKRWVGLALEVPGCRFCHMLPGKDLFACIISIARCSFNAVCALSVPQTSLRPRASCLNKPTHVIRNVMRTRLPLGLLRHDMVPARESIPSRDPDRFPQV